MSDLNHVTISGRLGQDPELKFTTVGNLPVCHISLAVESYSKTAEDNKKVIFVDVTLWGNAGLNAFKFLKKGRKVAVEGRLDISEFLSKTDGSKQKRLKVIGERVCYMDSAPKTGTEEGVDDTTETEAPTIPAPATLPEVASAPASEPLPAAPPAYLGRTRKNAKK